MTDMEAQAYQHGLIIGIIIGLALFLLVKAWLRSRDG